MELEEMKRIWSQTDERLAALESQISDMAAQAALGKRRTALDSLRRRYTIFSVVGCLMVGVMISYASSRLLPGQYSREIAIGMAVYFAIASVMDLWLSRSVRLIDVERMGVSEVSRRAMHCKRMHMRCMAVLIPMAVIIFGSLLWSATGDVDVMIALFVGASCGLFLGIRQYRRMMAAYSDLRQE